nr:hypothetical protein [Tanacetum cinerariifolium]
MTTVNQGMSIEEIERVVAQRVANAIEVIAIYETKTNIALKSMSQIERQEEEVARNASNKRRTNNSQTRGKTLAEPTLQGMGRRNITTELSHCVLNATITMMVHVPPNATSATELAN